MKLDRQTWISGYLDFTCRGGIYSRFYPSLVKHKGIFPIRMDEEDHHSWYGVSIHPFYVVAGNDR